MRLDSTAALRLTDAVASPCSCYYARADDPESMRVVCLLLIAALQAGLTRPALPTGPPGAALPTDSKGPTLRDTGFEAALAVAKDLPRLHSLLVSRRGELVLERYYNGARAARPANIKSASKSIISALVGIAIERRLIPAVDTPIVTWESFKGKPGSPTKALGDDGQNPRRKPSRPTRP